MVANTPDAVDDASDIALVGTIVAGRYEIQKLLGRGGMGAVYQALQRPLARRVALKVIRRSLSGDSVAVKRFTVEAQAISRLAHSNIVTIHDFGQEEGGLLFIAMEFLEGRSLGEELRAGPLHWRRTLTITREVVAALVEAHEHGIVHRDLKPDNVMLLAQRGSERLKVVDFGVAKLVEKDRLASQITATGMIVGTPGYISPEQLGGVNDDPRIDLYALGVMWFEMLTGQPPFEASSAIQLVLKHLNEAPPRPRDLASSQVPAEIDALVYRLLAKDPAARATSTASLFEECELLLHALGTETAKAENKDVPTASLSAVDWPRAREHSCAFPTLKFPEPVPPDHAVASVSSSAALSAGPSVPVDAATADQEARSSSRNASVGSGATPVSRLHSAAPVGPGVGGAGPKESVASGTAPTAVQARQSDSERLSTPAEGQPFSLSVDGQRASVASVFDGALFLLSQSALWFAFGGFLLPILEATRLSAAATTENLGDVWAMSERATRAYVLSGLFLGLAFMRIGFNHVARSRAVVAVMLAAVIVRWRWMLIAWTAVAVAFYLLPGFVLLPDSWTGQSTKAIAAGSLTADVSATSPSTNELAGVAEPRRRRRHPPAAGYEAPQPESSGTSVTTANAQSQGVARAPAESGRPETEERLVVVGSPVAVEQVPAEVGVTEPDAQPTEELVLRVRPWARVWLGQRELGRTPLKPLRLPPGRYELRLEWNDVVRKREVNIEKGRGPVVINIDMRVPEG